MSHGNAALTPRQRLRLARLVVDDQWSVSAAAEFFRVSYPTAAKWARRYVELGPGRGTLAADALRAMASTGLRPQVHFVETSPLLRTLQAERIQGAHFHDNVSSLPDDCALLVIANEFFDALPVYQLVKASDGWRERRKHVERRIPMALEVEVSAEDWEAYFVKPVKAKAHQEHEAAGDVFERARK